MGVIIWRTQRNKYLYETNTKGHYILMIDKESDSEVDVRRDSKKTWMLHVYLNREQVLYIGRENLASYIAYAVDHSPELWDIILLRFHTLGPGQEEEQHWLDNSYDRWISKDIKKIRKILTHKPYQAKYDYESKKWVRSDNNSYTDKNEQRLLIPTIKIRKL